MTKEICSSVPVVPVITINDVTKATTLAQSLVAGGLKVLEITLRTPTALQAIHEMAKVKGAVIGVGTLINAQQVKEAKEAGAVFGVSPGITDEIVQACEAYELPLLGGVATIGEAMAMLQKGYNFVKFFPAEINGGIAALKAFNAPLPQIKFCPTGGVSMANAKAYLALPNVICVGGSWLAPADLIEQNRFDEIEQRAKQAYALLP